MSVHVDDQSSAHPPAREASLHHRRSVIFKRSNVSYAPDSLPVPSDIDALAHLPAPHLIRRSAYKKRRRKNKESKEPQEAEKQTEAKRQSWDDEKLKESQGPARSVKQLPTPYEKQKTVIETRRAKRDFKYGQDDEYTITDRDRRVKAPCCGVLFFHTMELLDLTVNKRSFVDNIPISYYLTLSVGPIKRTTKIVHALGTKLVKVDSGVHLPIDISEYRDSPRNKIRLELWSFQDPEHQFIVGTSEMHIYYFIRLQHVIDHGHLWSDGSAVGKLAYETAFSYGAYGYGHSNQLINFEQPVMETVSHSMFPRIKLDEQADIADKAFQSRKPDNLKLLTYHSFILEMEDAKGRDMHDALNDQYSGAKRNKKNDIFLAPKPIIASQVEIVDGFPTHAVLRMNIHQKPLQADFNDMYGEYVCLRHKRERLEYLTKMVQGRMRDMFENEGGAVFQHLKDREIGKLSLEPEVPGVIQFPKKIPCASSNPVKLTQEDNEFQDKNFPQVRREPGYLDKLFGYEEKPDPSEFLNDMDFRRGEMKSTSKIEAVQTCCTRCRSRLVLFWLRLQDFFLRLWAFIFPDVSHNLEIPDISVTVATPEGSTTEIYSYFSREGKGVDPHSKVNRLAEQTSLLLGVTDAESLKRKRMNLKDEDETSSSSEADHGDEEKLVEDLKKKRLSKFD